jgi:Domain of unknown function (DUF4267)
MDVVGKVLAGTLAVGRMAFGINYATRPQEASRSWIGPVAKAPPAQVIVRSQGARDIALGAGSLRALIRGDQRELRAWVLGQTLADATDAVATWIARRKLPKRQAKLALIVAGASTLAGAGAAIALRPEPPSAPQSA